MTNLSQSSHHSALTSLSRNRLTGLDIPKGPLASLIACLLSLFISYLVAVGSLSFYFGSDGFAWAWGANAAAVATIFVVHQLIPSVSTRLLALLQAFPIFAANAQAGVGVFDNTFMTVLNTAEIAIVSGFLISCLRDDVLSLSLQCLAKSAGTLALVSLCAGTYFSFRYGAPLTQAAAGWFLSDIVAYIPILLLLIAFFTDSEKLISRRNVFGLVIPMGGWLMLEATSVLGGSAELLVALLPTAIIAMFASLRVFSVALIAIVAYEVFELPGVAALIESTVPNANLVLLSEFVFVTGILAAIAWQRFWNAKLNAYLGWQSEQLSFALDGAGISIFEVDTKNDLAVELAGSHRTAKRGIPFNIKSAMERMLDPKDAKQLSDVLSADDQSLQYRVKYPDSDAYAWSQIKTGKGYLSDGEAKRLVVRYDITDLMDARERLNDSFQQLTEQQTSIDLAADSAGLGFFKHDVLSNRVYPQPSYNRLFGLDPEVREFEGERIAEFIYEPDRERLNAKIGDILSNPRAATVEYRIVVDNKLKWVRTTVVPRTSEDGIFIHGTVQDIADEKSKALVEQLQQRIRAFSERTGGHYYTIRNLVTEEFVAAPGFLELLDFENPKAFLEATSTLENVHPSDRDQVRQYIEQALSETVSLDADADADADISLDGIRMRVKVQNGQFVWFQTALRKVVIDSVPYVVTSWNQIDSLVDAGLRAEEALEKLASAVDAAQLGTCEHNLTTHKLSVNAHLKAMFDLRGAEEITLDQIMSVIHPADLPQVQQFMHAQHASLEPGTLQFRLQTKNGIRWLNVSVRFKVNREGDPIAYFSYLDITEIKGKEAELERTIEELAERRVRQNEMFAIIAHELRTPLSAIKMMQEEQSLKTLEPFGQSIVDATDSVISILDDLRSVVNPDLAMSQSAVLDQPDSVVNRSLTPLRTLLKQKGLEVHYASNTAAGEYHLFNAQALRQITSNLVKNAALHSGASELSVSLSATAVENNQSKFILRVEDNGCGIDSDTLPKLFNAFSRGNSTAEGTGLGLHIAQTLAARLGGTIIYEPSQKGGACFVVEFILEQQHRDQNSEAKKEDADVLKGLNILFAEDQKTIQMISQKILERAGAAVTVADNGSVALERFETSDFDLVVTDIMMPELDGYGLTAALRGRGYTGPIIGVSAAVLGDETNKLLEAGANSVIAKPLSLGELVEEFVKIKST